MYFVYLLVRELTLVFLVYLFFVKLTINKFTVCRTVDALQEIASTMGATYWKFNGDLCQIEIVGTTPTKPEGSESSVDCECDFDNSTTCHVVRMYSVLISLVHVSFICQLYISVY